MTYINTKTSENIRNNFGENFGVKFGVRFGVNCGEKFRITPKPQITTE